MKWRGGELAWAGLLCLVPFAPFLDKRVDLWHAQTHALEAGLILLWLLSLSKPSKLRLPMPLILWLAWASLSTLWTWHQVVGQTRQYPLLLLMPLAHLAMIPLGLQAMCLLDSKGLERVIKVICSVGLILIAYGLLQWANLDQFFRDLDANIRKDVIVGTIGNPSHYAAYLAMLLPLLLIQRQWYHRLGVGLTLLLLILTHSAAALLAAWASLTWMAVLHRKYKRLLICLSVSVLAALYLWQHPTELNPHGRLEAWSTYWQMLQKKSLLGWGLGHVHRYSQTVQSGPIFQWRHCHNILLQVGIEQGLIGLSLLLIAIGSFFKRVWQAAPTRTLSAFSASFLAFAINSIFNFPTHLAVTASLGLFCYGACLLLTEEPKWQSAP